MTAAQGWLLLWFLLMIPATVWFTRDLRRAFYRLGELLCGPPGDDA